MSELSLPGGYGQVAYEAYVAEYSRGRSAHGVPFEPALWRDQAPEIQACWDAAAQAVIGYVNRTAR